MYDAFKQFEDTISQKVVAAVNEQHGAFVAAQEERWREFEDCTRRQAEAERARFEAAVAQAAQEQRQLLDQAISANSRVEAKIKETAAAKSQLESLRQELLTKQRDTLSEVRALLDDAKRTVQPEVTPDDRADALASAPPAGADAAAPTPGSPERARRQSNQFEPVASVAPGQASNPNAAVSDVVREPRRAVEDDDSEVEPPQLWGKQVSDMNLLPHSDPEPRPEAHALLRYLKVGSVMLLAVLLLGVIFFPYSSTVCLCTVCLWLLYLCGEEQLIRSVEKRHTMLARALRKVQGLRSSRRKEFCMKASLYTLSGCELIWFIVCLLSWLRFSLPAVVFTLLAFLVALLVKAPLFYRRGGSQYGSEGGSEAVNHIIHEITKNLSNQGHSMSWWSFGQRESEQRMSKIVNILVDCEKTILNELIERMEEDLVKDLVKFFQGNPDLLNMLSDRALDGHLDVQARWRLLHTLMSTGISSCQGAEEAVESLLVSVYGDELSELKSKQDSSGDRHSMHKLVFEDIKDEKRRMCLLNHFLVQGADQVARRSLSESGHFRKLVEVAKGRGWRDCGADSDEMDLNVYAQAVEEAPLEEQRGERGHVWLKIMTDIDDTMISSAGKWPSGIDDRYPRHTAYPGATVFYKELQGGVAGGHLVALSARPHIPGDMMEKTVFNKFENLMKLDNGLHAMPSLLTGSMEAGGKFLFTGGGDEGLKALCDKKYDNFKQYLSLYPEFRMVFIGDNGQADYALGQKVCREFPHNMLQVWIHEVQPRGKTFKFQSEKGVGAPIDYFEDYIAAAVSAATLTPYPLITPEGLRRVAIAAVRDFHNIEKSKHPWSSEGQRMAEAKRLNQSILRARQVMSFLGLEDLDDVILIDGERGAAPEESLMAWARGTMAARMLSRRPAALAGCQDAETQTAPECEDGPEPLDPASEAGSSPQAPPTEAPSALQKVRAALLPLGLGRGADSALPTSPRKDGEPAWDGAAALAAVEEASELPRTSSTTSERAAADAPAEAHDGTGDATTRGLLRSFFPGKRSDAGPVGTPPPQPEAAGAEGSPATSALPAGGEGPAPPEGPRPFGSSRQSLERQLVETREALDEREAELSDLRARLAALEGRQLSGTSSEDTAAAASKQAATIEAAAAAGDSSWREPSAGASLMDNVRRVFSGKTPDGDPRHRRPQSVQGSPKAKWLRSPAVSPESSRPGAGLDPSAFLLPASGAEGPDPAPGTPRGDALAQAPAPGDAPRTPTREAAADGPLGVGARAPSPAGAAGQAGPKEPGGPPPSDARGAAVPPAAEPLAAAAAAGANTSESGADAGAPPEVACEAADASDPPPTAGPVEAGPAAESGAPAKPRTARHRSSPTRGGRRGPARADALASGRLEQTAEESPEADGAAGAGEGEAPRGQEAATSAPAGGGGAGLSALAEAPRCGLARGGEEFASALSLADQSLSSFSLAENSCSELCPRSPSLCPTESESPAPGAAALPPAAAAVEAANGAGGPCDKELGGEAGPAC